MRQTLRMRVYRLTGNDKIYCGQRLMKSPESGLSSSTAEGRKFAFGRQALATVDTRPRLLPFESQFPVSTLCYTRTAANEK